MEDRKEIAIRYHRNGYNCCQCVLAAFADRLAPEEETILRMGAGFGGGAGTGELCGAVSGAVLTLGLTADVDVLGEPLAAKRAVSAEGRALQERFAAQFGSLRCRELLKKEKEEPSAAVAAMGLTNHCEVMIASAVELLEERLEERAGK